MEANDAAGGEALDDLLVEQRVDLAVGVGGRLGVEDLGERRGGWRPARGSGRDGRARPARATRRVATAPASIRAEPRRAAPAQSCRATRLWYNRRVKLPAVPVLDRYILRELLVAVLLRRRALHVLPRHRPHLPPHRPRHHQGRAVPPRRAAPGVHAAVVPRPHAARWRCWSPCCSRAAASPGDLEIIAFKAAGRQHAAPLPARCWPRPSW